MRTALVIGFGPFPGAPRNPSADLVRALAKRRRPALTDVCIIATVLPTTWAAAARALPALLHEHDPDIVLFFGLATRAKFVRVESRAVNVTMSVHPDAAGETLGARALIPGAPRELSVRAPVYRLLAAARSASATARVSRDAGRYICNASLFTTLDAARKSRRPRTVAFIHIPWPKPPSPARRRKRADRPAMATLVRAGEATLVALLSAVRRG